jgi:hypothetical protein
MEQSVFVEAQYLVGISQERKTMPQTTDGTALESHELAVTGTFFFCEVCNAVCEYGDPVWMEHHQDLKFHKMKRMLLLRCASCGNVVVDAYAEYSPERNQFWCRNCIEKTGYLKFRAPA